MGRCRLPWWRDGKQSACNARDPGSIPGVERSPGEGNGDPLQYPCLENSMDRGAWRARVHGVAKSCTRLSDLACTQPINLKGEIWVTRSPEYFWEPSTRIGMHICPRLVHPPERSETALSLHFWLILRLHKQNVKPRWSYNLPV